MFQKCHEWNRKITTEMSPAVGLNVPLGPYIRSNFNRAFGNKIWFGKKKQKGIYLAMKIGGGDGANWLIANEMFNKNTKLTLWQYSCAEKTLIFYPCDSRRHGDAYHLLSGCAAFSGITYFCLMVRHIIHKREKKVSSYMWRHAPMPARCSNRRLLNMRREASLRKHRAKKPKRWNLRRLRKDLCKF